MNIGDEFHIHVDRLAVGGAGVARTKEGFVLFITGAAPDEDLKVRITSLHKNHGFAEIIQIIRPGESRREPPCPVAMECGGCQWQHIYEDQQIKQKIQLVTSSFEKFLPNKLELPEPNIHPSPKVFGYRNRVQPKLKFGKFGYFGRESHSLIATDKCLIAEDAINDAWGKAKTWAQKQVEIQQLPSGEHFSMEIRSDEKGEVSFNSLDSEGPAFGQVNRDQNQLLIARVLEFAGKEFALSEPPNRVLELYSGAGNFTFPLAALFSQIPIVAVELNNHLVQFAKKQVQANKQTRRVDFRLSEVESFLRRFYIEKQDLVLLDPPRSGASEFIMRTLAKHEPKAIIYVSCHPVSLARDLAWFFKFANTSYHVNFIDIFDMFPQTDHVETLVYLTRSNTVSAFNL